jgi:hypothetical protein
MRILLICYPMSAQIFARTSASFFEGDSALPHGLSRAPVKALDLVGKDDILRCSGDQNLKRIIFDLRRERTTDQEEASS